MDGLGEQRQRTADALGDHDGKEHRDGNDQRDLRSVGCKEQDAQEIHHGEHHAQQRGDAHFLPENPADIAGRNLAQRQTADRQRRGLAAAVTAGIHQHGDARHQRHADTACGIGENVFIMGNDHAGKRGGDHQNQQPRQAVARHLPYAGFQVFIIGGQHCRHLFKVLGVFFFDNIHDIIDRDDAHQAILMIHNGDGKQVVLTHGIGDDFLVIGGMHGNHLLIHQILHLRIIAGEQQLAQPHRAEQLAIFIENVERIDGFLVHAGAANFRHRLTDRGADMEFHVFDRHDRTGAVFGVAQELVDQGTLLFIAALQHALDHARGQFFEEIDRVIDKHIVDQAHGLRIIHGFHDARALIVVHVGKDLRRNILRQQPEHHQHLIIFKCFQVIRNIHFVQHVQRAAQLGLFAGFQQRIQTKLDAIKIHCHHSFRFICTQNFAAFERIFAMQSASPARLSRSKNCRPVLTFGSVCEE